MPDLDQLGDPSRLRELAPDERRRLIRALVALEASDPVGDRAVARRRAIVLAAIIVCCVVLAAWIGVLAVTLPKDYRSGDWRGAWVGFDVVLLAVFAVTGWAAWRRRQVLIVCLVVLATLLCCDAWFDVVLDARTSGFGLSVLSAVCVELPLATLAILGARRLLRTNFTLIRRYAGEAGPSPSLRRGQLVSGTSGSTLSDLFADCAGQDSGPPPDIRAEARSGPDASLDGRPPPS